MATAGDRSEKAIGDLAAPPTASGAEPGDVRRLLDRGIVTDVSEADRARARAVYGVLDAAVRIRRAKASERASGIR